MTTFVRLRRANANLCMYHKDHNPPHFHVRGPGFDAAIRIDTLQIIAGHLDKRTYNEVCAWVTHNKQKVEQIWAELNP